MKHVIRLATEADADGINKVSKHLGYSELPRTEARDKLHELINSPQDVVYVSESNGHIIGWLHLIYARRLASADFYEIGGLVVTPDARGQGVGRSLVQYVLEQHSGKIRVRCNELRAESHQFYKAIGFSRAKVQRVFEIHA